MKEWFVGGLSKYFWKASVHDSCLSKILINDAVAIDKKKVG